MQPAASIKPGADAFEQSDFGLVPRETVVEALGYSGESFHRHAYRIVFCQAVYDTSVIDSDQPRMIYLGRSRLHRMRANLIQTVHTVSAIHRLGQPISLVLPRGTISDRPAKIIRDIGGDPGIDLCTSWLLRPGLGYWPYLRTHASQLRQAAAIYTRVPDISLCLSAMKIPHHLEIHDTQSLRESHRLDRLIQYHCEGTIHTLVPISEAARAALIDAGADAERIHVAPSGVDVAAYTEVPDFDPASLDRPRTIYLGRLSKSRGLDIFEAVAQSGVASVELVGQSADDTAAIQRLQGVKIHPFVAPREVPAWYGRCDIALLPYQPGLAHAASISPIKLFEAMAAGRPILISDLPALRGIVTHEHDALLIPHDDPSAWIDAIKRLQNDRDFAARLAHNAKQRAPHFDWSVRAKGILNAIGLGDR